VLGGTVAPVEKHAVGAVLQLVEHGVAVDHEVGPGQEQRGDGRNVALVDAIQQANALQAMWVASAGAREHVTSGASAVLRACKTSGRARAEEGREEGGREENSVEKCAANTVELLVEAVISERGGEPCSRRV
jgi:hypothetical protein